MHQIPPLPAQLPPEQFLTVNGDGDPGSPDEVIFPIVSQRTDGTFVPIGTGFFISNNGLFVTAAHVVREVLDSSNQSTAPFGILRRNSEGSLVLRPILRTVHHPTADVAVGFAAPLLSQVTGQALPNALLILAREPPRVGDAVHTYAFPRTRIEPGQPQWLHLFPGAHKGSITQHFPEGRDSVILKDPCYETSMVIHAGASGGPVFTSEGLVFAINSTSFGEDPISFVSCISPILDFRLDDVLLPGESAPRSVLVRELCARGIIQVR